MGDQNHRSAGDIISQLPADLGIRLGIHSREGIIKNHDRCAAHQHPGNGSTLLLTAGEGDTPLTDEGIVSVRKALHRLIQAGNSGSPPDFMHAGFLSHELLFLGLRDLIAGIPFRLRHGNRNIFHQRA